MSADDQFAIRDVISRYCHTCDDGDVAALANLFTPNAEYAVGDSVHVGRAAIAAHFVEVAPMASVGKHLTANTVVTFQSRADATAVSDWLYLVHGHGMVPLAAGRYIDRFRKADGNWLFTRRQVAVFETLSTP